MATATGRLGYAWDRVLVFAKGGAAWTVEGVNGSCNGDALAGFVNGCISSNGAGKVQNLGASNDRLGWTAGAGFEIGLTPNWSTKIEYDYLDFGTRNITLPDTTRVGIGETFHQVKVGVNYRFGASDPDATVASANMALKAPPAAPVNWTGVYMGGSLGDRLADPIWTTSALAGGRVGAGPGFDETTSPASFASSTPRLGGYLGYNWQFAPKWVAGLEGDIAWGNSSMTSGGIPGAFGNGQKFFPSLLGGGSTFIPGTEAQSSDAASVKLGWDGSIRGRLGFLANPNLMIYGTGGVTFQQVDVNVTCDGTINSWCGNNGNAGARSDFASSIRTGWTAGAGIEATLRDRWLGRLEFRYAEYGNFNNVFFTGTSHQIASSMDLRTLTFLTGMSYKFK